MDSPLIIKSNTQSPTITTNSIQPIINPFNSVSNEILDRINNSPFFRIVFEPKKCCDNNIYISVFTLSTIDDLIPSNENENFLLKAIIKSEWNLCNSNVFEVKCFTGPNFDSANDYFCSFRIEKKCCCFCLENCCCNKDLDPMTLNIPSNKIGINNEICIGNIDRIANYCTGFNARRFFDCSENVYKYQIGRLDCYSSGNLCEFYGECCSFYCGCCRRKRYLFKIILDNSLNQCGEFNIVTSNDCWEDNYYEIRFPNDANVYMKLLLLGGLFEAALLPYVSNPDNIKSINAAKSNSLKMLYVLSVFFGIFLTLILFLLYIFILTY